jgi:hypothetical protein
MEESNPRVSRVLLTLTWIEVVVVGAAAGLWTLPGLVVPFWPWTLTPFNAFFVGATYFAAWIPLVIFAWVGRWNPGRVVLPMIGAFTLYVLIISLVGAGSLLWDRFGTYIWMALYIILPISSGYFLWRYRDWKPVAAVPTPSIWRAVLIAQAVLVGLYGLAMLVAPGPVTQWWPWPIDTFNGRMYGANFVTLAVGSLVLSRVTSRLELLTLGLTAFTLGVVSVVGLYKTDIGLNRIQWTAPGTIAWIALFAVMAVIGGAMALASRALAPAKAEAEAGAGAPA